MLPLYFQQAIWATRARIQYEARADEYTLAISARPAAR
jgi:peptide/nickel transport system substrate-binding protein